MQIFWNRGSIADHAYDLTNYWSIFVRFEFSDKNTLYNDGWVRPQPRFIERTNSI